MTLLNDEIGRISMRFSAGSGVAIVNTDTEIGVGIFGIRIVLLAINRDCAECPDDDCMSENQEIAMDGGTVRREKPIETPP